MSTIKFNHETPLFSEAVGMSEKDLNDLGEKLATFSLTIIKENKQPGDVAEWIVNNLSYTDMIFMTMKHIFSELHSATKYAKHEMETTSRKSIPKNIKDLLKFLDKTVEDGDEDINLGDGSKMHIRRISTNSEGKPDMSEFFKNIGKMLDKTNETEENEAENLPEQKSKSAPTFEELKEQLRRKSDDSPTPNINTKSEE